MAPRPRAAGEQGADELEELPGVGEEGRPRRGPLGGRAAVHGGEEPGGEQRERRREREERAEAGAPVVEAEEQPQDAEVEEDLREHQRVPEMGRADDRGGEGDAARPRRRLEPAHPEGEPEHQQRGRGGEGEEAADHPVREDDGEDEQHRPAIPPQHAEQVERRQGEADRVERPHHPAGRLQAGDRADGAQHQDGEQERREREPGGVRAEEGRGRIAAVSVDPREDEEVRVVLHRQEVGEPERYGGEDRERPEDQIEEAVVEGRSRGRGAHADSRGERKLARSWPLSPQTTLSPLPGFAVKFKKGLPGPGRGRR